MASIETLILQIFDRKRQIIDQLKQHSLFYDQHLASKLFLHGISPPSWLLPNHFPNPSSDYSALDKAGLISGLLHPRPVPVSSYPGNHGYLHDKTVSVFNNSVTDGACAGNRASSTGCDEDASSVIPLCIDDVTDDRAAIVGPSNIDNIVYASTYAPMSPENQCDTSICDTHPKQEQSLVKIQRSRSRQKALEIRKSAKTSSKSRLGITNNVGTISQNKSCQRDEDEESSRARSPYVSNCLLTQFTNNEVKEVHTGDDQEKETNNSVYVSSITRSSSQAQQFNSAEFSNNDVKEAHTGDVQKKETNNCANEGGITLSSSQAQQSNSAQFANDEAKEVHTEDIQKKKMNNSAYEGRIARSNSILSESKALEHDAQLDGSTELIESDEASALPTEIFSLEDESRTCSAKRNGEAPCVTQLRDLTMNNSAYEGRITRSDSILSESKVLEHDAQLDGSMELIESDEASALPTQFSSLEDEIRTCSAKRNSDAPCVAQLSDLTMNNNGGSPSENKNSEGDEKANGLIKSLELAKPFSASTNICSTKKSPIKVVNNNGGSPSENKSSEGDEKTKGLINSLELVKPFSALTNICTTKESPIKVSSPGSCADLLNLSTKNEAKASHEGDNLKTEKSDILYAGRITRSKSVCQPSAGVSSGSLGQYYPEQLRRSRGSIVSHKAFELPATVCSSETSDACDTSLSRDLQINNIVNIPSGNNNFREDEQLNHKREAFSIPTKTCNEEEALTKSDKFSSRCQLFKDAPSGSIRLGSSDQLCGLSASPPEICSWKEADAEPCLTKESCDATGISLTKSADRYAEDGQTRNIKEKKSSSYTGDRLTAFASSCQVSFGSPFTTKTSGDGEKIDDIKDFADFVKHTASPMGIFSQGEEEIEKRIPEMQHYELSGGNALITTTGKKQSPASGLLNDQQRTLLEPSDCYSKELEVETERGCDKLYDATVSGQVVADSSFSGTFPTISKEKDCENSPQAMKKLKLSTVSPVIDHIDFGEADQIPRHKQLQASDSSIDRQRTFVELSDGYSKELKVETEPGYSKLYGTTVSGQVVADSNFSVPLPATNKEKDCENSLQAAKKLTFPTVSPVIERMVFGEVDQAMVGDKQLPASGLSIDKQRVFVEPSDCYSKKLEVDSEPCSVELYGATISGMANGQVVADSNFSSSLPAISKEKDCEKSSMQAVNKLQFSTVSPVIDRMDVDEADEAIPGHQQLPASGLSIDEQRTFVEPSGCHSKELEVETGPGFAELYGATVNGMVNCQVVTDSKFSGPLPVKEKDWENSLQAVKKLKFSIVSPVIERMDVDEADQAMPEYESFGSHNFGDKFLYDEIPLLSDVMEHPSLHEHISGSASFSTPVSPFPAACKPSAPLRLSTNNAFRSSQHEQQRRSACLSTPLSPFPDACNLHLDPAIYSSVPNGILENIDLRSNLLPAGSALQRKSHSDFFSFPHNLCGQDLRKPFLSPVEIGFENMTSKSGGSEKVRSGNPELICFTILEDPESPEEDVNEVKRGVEGTDLSRKNSSIREPLCDITVKNNSSLVRDDAVEKRSIESTSTDVSVSEVCDVNSQVNGTSHRQTRQTTRGNENKGFSVGGSSFKKNSKAFSSRFSKPKISGQSNLRGRGQSMSEKEPKRNNIVSNVKSFIPLVQQKQAAAAAPVKRAVKVKALEAAEAAKLLAEKKEIERKQKKEAQKAERARLEQENLKQLELAKKLKEQAKKKREAENAAKKRQREEEEKNDKERKRKRVEDARCQQKQAQEKIHAWREESRYGAPEEERTLEEKKLDMKAQKDLHSENEIRVSSKLVNELVDGGIKMKAGDGLPTLSDNVFTEFTLVVKVDSVPAAESITPNLTKSNKPTSRKSEEQSYDISPYQCSDDEGEEEDDMPNQKFIPSWARKSCVSLALSSQHMDPETIFPPGSFCSLDEVLMPQRLPQKSKK